MYAGINRTHQKHGLHRVELLGGVDDARDLVC